MFLYYKGKVFPYQDFSQHSAAQLSWLLERTLSLTENHYTSAQIEAVPF